MVGKGLTTLGGDDTALTQGIVQKLEVWLLEQSLRGAVWVRTVRNDHIEAVLVVCEELEAVADVDLDLGVLEANTHARQVFLAKTNDCLVDVS